MSIAFVVSQRSCDPSTKHGAVLSNKKKQIIGVGYNGFPRGGNDHVLPTSRPSKYGYIIHAESNCILNSQNLLLSDNYVMHVTGFPCNSCMLLMIQSGVKTVVYGPITSACVDHKNISIVRHLANEYNINMVYYGGPFLIGNLSEKYNCFKGAQNNPFEYNTIQKEETNDTEIRL
jgi:deoxycytidylate deaminase